eukprot:TRINITY_DN5960_c0_g1_i1.p1 TRINITY_DN5960_c0_g1~~TRINITY_DN5960_c0_g1_i1.p1  ORF type:complete len:116 (-),score=31.52 TRINITY_DN5960_c0_g1_i1:56-403(-)
MLVSFSKKMDNLWALLALLEKMRIRLDFGVKEEVLPLVEIRGVKGRRARALWNAGFRSVTAIAQAKIEDIMNSVKLGPYAHGVAKQLISNAKKLLEQKVKDALDQLKEANQKSPG